MLVGNLGELSPHEARDAADFVASMQQLKKHTGLTYRQLEERAARNGDVLARSTLADILRRTSLPRPDVLAAFVRACGDGRRLDAWLEARDRIARLDTVPPATPAPETETEAEAEAESPSHAATSTGSPPRRTPVRPVALALALVVPLLALLVWWLLPDDSPGAPTAAGGTSPAPADGWVTIRSARAPGLCLTDGRDRDGAYASAIAALLPCAQAPVPRTYLEPAGAGLHRVQWHHPQEGRGCLAIMTTGPVKGMLEPRDDCGRATLFRLEATASDSAEGFRLRPVHSGRCIGIADDHAPEGAEAVEERCTGAADQRFLIRAG